MSKRILVISWFFPPINSSEGLVTVKLLNNSKYDYDVFTQSNNESWSYGKSESILLNSNINRIESNAKDLNECKKEAISFFEKNKNKYDIVMTRSMPETSHTIGLEIKAIKPEINWIASFGDPIGNNPFTLKSIKNDNPYALKQRYIRPMGIKEMISPFRIIRSFRCERNYRKNYKQFIKDNNELQKRIINNCDYIIFNSTYQKDYMLNEYSNIDIFNKKSIILPHSYDEAMYKKTEKKSDKLIFTYVGLLDDIRTPHELFIALERLKKVDPNVDKKVEFNFYGNMSDKEKLYIIDNDLLNIVKIHKGIDYIKSLEIMQEADWLILIDANISDITDKNIFFAAKIADYIGAKRKIFGITMIDGISADMLRDYNSLCLENNAEEIFNYLYLILYENYDKKIDLDYRKKYNSKKVAEIFDQHLETLEKEELNAN